MSVANRGNESWGRGTARRWKGRFALSLSDPVGQKHGGKPERILAELPRCRQGWAACNTPGVAAPHSGQDCNTGDKGSNQPTGSIGCIMHVG